MGEPSEITRELNVEKGGKRVRGRVVQHEKEPTAVAGFEDREGPQAKMLAALEAGKNKNGFFPRAARKHAALLTY